RVQAVPGKQSAVWIAPDGSYIDVVERPGQGALKVVMEDVFEGFTSGTGRHVPSLREPARGVVVDPEVRGGFPVIAGTRIPFNIIAGLHADGLPPAEIAELYPSVTPEEIEGATELAELVALNSPRAA